MPAGPLRRHGESLDVVWLVAPQTIYVLASCTVPDHVNGIESLTPHLVGVGDVESLPRTITVAPDKTQSVSAPYDTRHTRDRERPRSMYCIRRCIVNPTILTQLPIPGSRTLVVHYKAHACLMICWGGVLPRIYAEPTSSILQTLCCGAVKRSHYNEQVKT